MADTFTSNYNWTLPEVGASSTTWGTKLNANFTDVDLKVKANANAIATNTSNIATNTSNISSLTTTVAGKLDKSGGTMTGPLTVGGLVNSTSGGFKFPDGTTQTTAATTAAAQVNADWNSVSGVSQILNKPTLGGAASLSVGTSAGTVAAGNDTRITGAAPLASPTFTGVPAAPTATAGTNTTQLATTAFVQAATASAGVGVYGAVGSFVFATANTGVGIAPNGTFTAAAGNPLTPSDASGVGGTAITSGVWRCMGNCGGSTSPTLWYRVS